jgi:hypothetical protein
MLSATSERRLEASTDMSECTTIIALAERLRGHSRVAWRRGRGEFAGDLRLAEHYLRRHAEFFRTWPGRRIGDGTSIG